MAKNNQKPDTTEITESASTWEVLQVLRGMKIKQNTTINFEELYNIVQPIFIEKYGGDCSDNLRYFKYIFGHAEKNLKKQGIITIEGKGAKKVYKDIVIEKPEPFDELGNENIEWDTKTTIRNIFEFVDSKKHLIPSFQRATAWTSAKDYQELAYSIYKSVPLGLMYFWKIDHTKALKIGHYAFKREIEKGKKIIGFTTIEKNEMAKGEVTSVIDGQQRITGINIIINGTFNGMKLFFNEEQEGYKKFQFKKDGKHAFWTKLEDIYYELGEIHDNIKKLERKSKKKKLKDKEKNKMFDIHITALSNKLFISEKSLKSLYNGFFKSNLIVICELPNIELVEILQVFIRTNQFGKKLKATDIMISSLIGENKNIREYIAKSQAIMKSKIPNYPLEAMLKMVSLCFSGSPKIHYKTFFDNNAKIVEDKGTQFDVKKSVSWTKFNKAINATFKCLNEQKFDLKWLNSFNSLAPIVWWIYHKNGSAEITDTTLKNDVNRYLLLAQILKTYSSSTDDKLSKIVKQVDENNSFANWSDSLNTEELEDKLLTFMKTWRYGKDNNKIKVLLHQDPNISITSNSIEHLIPQSQSGSDDLSNLAILPKELNSELQDKPLNEKIEIICIRKNKTREAVLEELILTEDEVKDNEINKDERIKKMLAKILPHI